MPRRAAALATPTSSTPLTDGTHNLQQDDPFAAELTLLRRQWKWAAFSQFFYTFAALFAMPDVSLTDIEDDLTRSTSIVIHRVMHRLLVTATQDRKLSLESWQTALRKQYRKRDPDLNPIGPEPVVQLPTPASDSPTGPDDEETKAESVSTPSPSSNPLHQVDSGETDDGEFRQGHSAEPFIEPKPDEMKTESMSVEGPPLTQFEEESKDWLTLPMLMKLDSLHLLTEWQFSNVNRLRTIMKDDDETAQWRIEPIGYDSKANAYWLIGPDRLWIQRDIPKPPRNRKRKRAPTKPKPKSSVPLTDDESNTPPAPKKRKAPATARSSTIKISAINPQTPSRSTRTRRPPSSPEELGPITSRGPRAAKMQASVKLSAQAKELAELQRQAALENRRSGRRIVSPSPPRRSSPRRPRALGTRVSARLRGGVQDDDEWQEIPDEWLNEVNNAEEDAGGSGSEQLDEEADVGHSSDPNPQPEPEPEAIPDADMDTPRAKTGLESDDDAVSELTELSEISQPATVLVSPKKPRKASKKGSSSRRKTSQSKRQTLVIDEPEPTLQLSAEEEIEPEWRPPDDFVEWETICVTLYDWEHICERFEGATHYAEKALYKVLSQHIVPEITAELREIQRKRQMEDAVSQRKRSSRLAMKESEKEEARLTALRKAEEEEKMSRLRRLEARQKREEDERLKREAAREKRRLDREERERKAQAEEEEKTNASSSINVVRDSSPQRKASTKAPKAKPGRPRTKITAPAASSSASASGSRTPVGEDWMLDCEICHQSGVNKDDGSPLLCCGKCSKWQHIACHDMADRNAGRPKRDWDAEEFICRTCQGRNVPNGRQFPNGSSASYDLGRTPSPYYHQPSGYPGQASYSQKYPPHPHLPRLPYPQHTATTFSYYQPQQHGFSSNHSPSQHAQVMSQAATYAQPHHGPHLSPSKLSQYSTPQYSPHVYSNGTTWPTPAPTTTTPTNPRAHSAASWSAHLRAHAPQGSTGYATMTSSSSYNSSAERFSMSSTGAAAYANAASASASAAAAVAVGAAGSGAGPAQNGSGAMATASVSVSGASAATALQSQSWRGSPYVTPVGGGGGGGGNGSSGVSYYSQSSRARSPPQHRAP